MILFGKRRRGKGQHDRCRFLNSVMSERIESCGAVAQELLRARQQVQWNENSKRALLLRILSVCGKYDRPCSVEKMAAHPLRFVLVLGSL